MHPRLKRTLVAVGVLTVALAIFVVSRNVCIGTWWRTRVVLRQCPDGALRQTATLRASDLRRGAEGGVVVGARAHYTLRDAESQLEAPVGDFSAKLAVVDGAGKETPLTPVGPWEGAGKEQRAVVKLPELPDGDYLLRGQVSSRLGEASVDLPMPLYAPARVHIITDRPLYEPGNTMKFRAVILRARDLVPLDGRPGRWMVKDPSGEVLLEEKAPAGAWGVVAGSFPLDKAATTGTWKIAWTSADAVDEVAVTVEPFTLPRFRVEAQADKPYYRAGERPVLRGAATYSSGAPVAAGAVGILWNVVGDWPPPTEWKEGGGLPALATTGPEGRFELTLPQVPSDLEGQATLVARIAVVDAAGDRVEGRAAVLLSKDGIRAEAVTDLADGLVSGFNNRLYLRVATADGRPLPGAKIRVRRAWEARDPGLEATLDEDGVGALQLDPGMPVNVVIPAKPYRAPPRRKLVLRGDTRELLGGAGASLDDQVAMDRWLPSLEPCAKHLEGAQATLTLGLRADERGAITSVTAPPGPLGGCLADGLRAARVVAGAQRVFAVSFTVNEPDAPRIDVSVDDVVAPKQAYVAAVQRAARDARDCLPPTIAEGALPRALLLRARRGQKALELSWVRDPHGIAALDTTCVERRFAGLQLDEPAAAEAMSLVRLHVALPERLNRARPQPTVMQGYELLVSAATDGNPSTVLRLAPGSVPPLRVRLSPVVAAPGERIAVELIRGPDYHGEVPDTVVLTCLKSRLEAKVDKETRKTEIALDAAAEGWCEVAAVGVRARLFVKPKVDLAVSVTPDKERYQPGQSAELAVHTTSAGQGTQAAVGLFGVDDSLAQLAPLPGADDLARVRPPVVTSSPAFGVLDGQALTMGRVRGANAAAATVLRVNDVPTPPELDAVFGGAAQSPFDATALLTDRFYVALAELHAQARRWEKEAPASEKMVPPIMAELWKRALEACAERGERIEDAFGRPMALHRLPVDLLAQTDPRQVVVNGARLPEDVESWPTWVARVRP